MVGCNKDTKGPFCSKYYKYLRREWGQSFFLQFEPSSSNLDIDWLNEGLHVRLAHSHFHCCRSQNNKSKFPYLRFFNLSPQQETFSSACLL